MHFRKMVSTFYKNYLEKPIATSTSLEFVPSILKLTIQLPAKQKRGRSKKRTIKHVKSDDKEKSESVWFLLKPEVGRMSEICFPGVKRVKEPVVAIWLFAVWLRPRTEQHFIPTKCLLKQVLSLTIFHFPIFNPGWKVFSLTILIFYDLLISSPISLIG